MLFKIVFPQSQLIVDNIRIALFSEWDCVFRVFSLLLAPCNVYQRATCRTLPVSLIQKRVGLNVGPEGSRQVLRIESEPGFRGFAVQGHIHTQLLCLLLVLLAQPPRLLG